jgi:hypothetical protein
MWHGGDPVPVNGLDRKCFNIHSHNCNTRFQSPWDKSTWAVCQHGRVFPQHNDLPPVEMLKNALLACALATVYHSKGGVVERTDVDDASYDGTKLPSMNGCNISNACFTFIESPQHAARGPWGSQFRVDKANAVQKYIKANLSTEQEVDAFFIVFVESLHQYRTMF